MSYIPMDPECGGFVPLDGTLPFSPAHKNGHVDCTECVYFSRRNCGRDTGTDEFLFDRQLL